MLVTFAKLPRLSQEFLDEVERDIEDLRENFIVVDLTMYDTEDEIAASTGH